MLAWKTKLLTICSFCSLFFPTNLLVLAQATVENTPTATASGVYQQAKEKLPSDLSATQPLTYDLSKNGESLKINSRHGASVADDIDAKFGK